MINHLILLKYKQLLNIDFNMDFKKTKDFKINITLYLK